VKTIVAIAFVLVNALAAAAGPCPEVQIQTAPAWGTPLHEAIRRNDVAAAQSLMTAAMIDSRDSLGDTPLVAALTPAQLLEPAGLVSADKRRALIQAENMARQEIVSALLAKGARVNERGAGGTTPLMQLAAWGYSSTADHRLAEQLLRSGAIIDARDASLSTALMLAARRGKTDLVTLLLSKGADPRMRNCHDETAASLAQSGGYTALAEQLTAASAK
jgi:uncharacterized protein